MPTERMEEVEVVVTCTRCGGLSPACWVCEKSDGKEVALLPIAPNSLTAARLRLADAAEAWLESGHLTASATFSEALAKQSMASHALDLAGQKMAALRTARGEG